MEIKKNCSLKEYNTFAIDVKADSMAIVNSIDDLKKLQISPDSKNTNSLVIGAGSNILFTSDYKGLIIKPDFKGITVLEKHPEYVLVKAGAGENWDSFVNWSVENGYGGLENLSLIPGTIGACPVQNIGAYGVEVGEMIYQVSAFDMYHGVERQFSAAECQFSYRNSVFKSELKGRVIITSVTFKLFQEPVYKLDYGAVRNELSRFKELNLKNIRQAIINIRQSKLPDPVAIPNAGSFFKNPSVSKEKAETLQIKYPDLVSYKNDDGTIKLAAGWLIDKLGWKGKTFGNAGVHDKQALVLVNKNNSDGKQILQLAEMIKESVTSNFGIDLEYEVNIV